VLCVCTHKNENCASFVLSLTLLGEGRQLPGCGLAWIISKVKSILILFALQHERRIAIKIIFIISVKRSGFS